MTRPVLALFASFTALFLSTAAHAETEARACPEAYDRGMAFQHRVLSPDPVDKIMVDLLSLRLTARLEGYSSLRR